MTLDASIPSRIVELIEQQDWPVGSHLPAQKLADLLRVSRSPINEALQLLHDKGLVERQPNRGYFVARRIEGPSHHTLDSLGLRAAAASEPLYFRIAEGR